jgi:hypothetical protein
MSFKVCWKQQQKTDGDISAPIVFVGFYKLLAVCFSCSGGSSSGSLVGAMVVHWFGSSGGSLVGSSDGSLVGAVVAHW